MSDEERAPQGADPTTVRAAHHERADATALCACGAAPPGYALPTDHGQWAIWDQWLREHVTSEVEKASWAAMQAADAERAQRAGALVDLTGRLTNDGAQALRRRVAALVRAGLADSTEIESVSAVEESPDGEVYLEIDGQNVAITIEIL